MVYAAIQDEVRQRWSKTHRVTSEHRWEDVVATLKSASGSHNVDIVVANYNNFVMSFCA